MGKKHIKNYQTPSTSNKNIDNPKYVPIFSKEEYIDFQAEAYFKALKRIEEEKKEIKTSDSPSLQLFSKEWFLKFFSMILFLLFPFKKYKRLFLNRLTPQGYLLSISSEFLKLIGVFLWFIGIIMVVLGVIMHVSPFKRPIWFIIGILSIIFGVYTYHAGYNSSKIKDESNSYAFSACVLSIMCLLCAIISILITINPNLLSVLQ